LVDDQRLGHGALGQQQGAVVAVGFQVLGGELAALVGVVPVGAAAAGDLRGAALPAGGAGALHVLERAFLPGAVAIQRPHQSRA
ncbi:hypothetical protein AOR11_24615, partial [Vibrio alginolyticus]